MAPNQVTIDFSNFGGELDLNWEYHGPLGIHFSGNAQNTFSQTNINTLFTFDANSRGAPAITLNSLDVQINHLDIHISGVIGWLIDLLVKLLKGLLIDILQKKIDSVATSTINNLLAKIEEKYPLVMPLTGALLNATQLELGLVPGGAPLILTEESVAVPSANTPAPFEVSGDYMIASGEWFFESTLNGTVDPRQHDWIPDSMPANPAGKPPMLGFAFSEPLLGTLLWSLTENGVFDFTLDNSKLPPGSAITLNTKDFSVEYPNLYAKYPNYNLTLDFAQYYEFPPLSTTSPQGTTVSNQATMMMNVVDESQPNPIVPVCQILLNYSVTINLDIKDNTTDTFYIVGEISPLEFEATILWAALDPGAFGSDIGGLITAVANDLVVPIVNGVLQTGFAIPAKLDVIGMENVFVEYGQSKEECGRVRTFDAARARDMSPDVHSQLLLLLDVSICSGNHVVSFGFDVSLPSEEARQEAAQALIDW